MSDPVFDRLETQWAQQSRTPMGYPDTPDYQPGTYPNTGGARQTPGTAQGAQQTAGTIPYGASCGKPNAQTPQHPGGPLEEAYHAPAADAVGRGVMTYDDVITKMAISMGVLFVSAFISRSVPAIDASLGAMLSLIGFIGGFVLAMMSTFSKKVRPALTLAYAGFKGLTLDTVSQVFELIYPGIVVQALIAATTVFGVTLALFVSGKVQNPSKLARFTLIALVSILVYRLLPMMLTLTGVLSSDGFDSIIIMGIPLGIAVGLIVVFVGASCLIQDFDQTKIGMERGVPTKYAWACTSGALVTVMWMYLEIFRFIAHFRNN